jgi:heavy metal translocating P-type ATPase
MLTALLGPKKRLLIDQLKLAIPVVQNGHRPPVYSNGNRAKPAPRQSQIAAATASYQALQHAAMPMFNALIRYVTAVDAQWQRFVYLHIDPLLGGARAEHLRDLGIQMSAAEKDMNRRLLLAVGNIGVALVTTHLFPPFALLNISFVIWVNLPIYQRGYRTWMEKRRLTYAVILIGAQIAIIAGGHFVPGSVMTFMVRATEKIINRTEDHFRRNLIDALGQQPRTVSRWVNGGEVETPLAAIQEADALIIGAGETIAVDGVILAGAALIDQQRLTGEAQPAEKTVGDGVLAATVVLSGKIQVQVQKTGAETSAAQIAVILQRVAGARLTFTSRVQNFTDSMTVPMLALGSTALLTLGTEGAAAIISVGVGSIVRFGGPLAMLNYLNIAARSGLLIKDARSLELLKAVDTIVFDKTGTLTLEQPHISHIHLCQAADQAALSEALLLRYAAAAESKQTHPIAKAILTAAQARGLAVPPMEAAQLEIGYGIKARLPQLADHTCTPAAERLIHVGSRRFMAMEGIAIPAELEAVQEACHRQGHSLVLVAVNGQVAGAFELKPTLRPEARQAITALRQRGLALYIISGDHAAPTQQLAQTLGIEQYFAGVLPQDKASLVEQLKANGRKVCFVGDGINDALALGQANVSVSLRGAATLATDTAQVVLMSQDLRHLEFLLKLAHEFDQSLQWLFRLTLVPVGVAAVSTFWLHTGIYTSILIWQLGILGGLGMGFLPLLKHPTRPTRKANHKAKSLPAPS